MRIGRVIGILGVVVAIGAASAASASAAVLYNQNNSGTIAPAFSDSTSGFPEFTWQAADDFTVPLGQKWKITKLNVTQHFLNEAPQSQTVTFYTDIGQHPGKVKNTQTVVGVATADTLTLMLAPFGLPAGHYWVSVVANQTDLNNQWYWDTRSTQNGSAAVQQNPGGGVGMGCSTWWYLNQCLNTNAGPDLMFSLNGKVTTLPKP